jgi:tetraacyldisaccharide 4'-kinase
VLAPLSAIYGRAVLARRRHIEARPRSRQRLTRPVISIGNLAVGGSGKTPFTRWLASRLVAAGQHPSILSRGYRRQVSADEVVIVSDGARVLVDLARAGDEPLMLAETVPGARVLVCADRYRAGQLAESSLGCTVHLLDDGFQHLRLERDVNLLLLDARDVADRVMPAGRLREPLDAARSADALLWTGDADAREVADRLGIAVSFDLRRDAGAIVAAGAGRAPVRGSGVLALAGIARPHRFFDELAAAGLDVRARIAFRDHHPYTAEDVRRIHRALGTSGAEVVVTTEKDLVRLRPLGELPFDVAWRRLDVQPRDPDAFFRWMEARLAGITRTAARGGTLA